jgi:hypothetical protein
MYGGRRGVNTVFRWGDLRERGNLEDVSVEKRIILKYNFNDQDGMASSGFISLRVETGGGLL